MRTDEYAELQRYIDSLPDDDLTIDNAYKTRWVWLLALELLVINVLLVTILTKL